MSAIRLTILAVLLAWPALFQWLAIANYNGPALIWFVLHQIYYLPLSWVGPPFFVADSEVQFFVQWPARMLTALIYGLLFWAVALVLDRRSKRKVGHVVESQLR
jgi:hypothetical protein